MTESQKRRKRQKDEAEKFFAPPDVLIGGTALSSFSDCRTVPTLNTGTIREMVKQRLKALTPGGRISPKHRIAVFDLWNLLKLSEEIGIAD
ncbi:hypothetical protein [Larkinella terrae]|uniref:Uncharacterized protein n=1 Tax=Larkinella terrae TaxID=2025311 RepID=A0A7K0EJ80_9BACT|nr:hypothetical protein [Larkinella terrae]MRS61815.1 hypothetical protein [Larkinella terrae]